MSVKKTIVILIASCFLFTSSSSVFAATSIKNRFTPYSTINLKTEPNDPIPSPSPEPEPQPDPQPSPEPQPDPEPSPEPQPDPQPSPESQPPVVSPENTPSSNQSDSSNSSTYEESYDDYDPIMNNVDSTSDTEFIESTEEKAQEVFTIEGQYPVTVSIKETTIDVELNANAYTISSANTNKDVSFNEEALLTALNIGKVRLDEKTKNGDTKLNQIRILVPALMDSDLKNNKINLQINGNILSSLKQNKTVILFPIDQVIYTISPNVLTSDALNDLGNSGRLIISIKNSNSPKDKNYKISESVLTPISLPIQLEIITVKSTGALTTLETFESPIPLYYKIDDATASKLKENTSFTGVLYHPNHNTMTARATNYKIDSKTIVFSANQPGEYLIALKSSDAKHNILLLIPCFLGILVILYLTYSITKKKTNI